MRKVIVNVAVSLDGFIEGPQGEYDWCFTDQDYGMTDFLKSIDAVFYGRKSYEMMLSADASGENPFSGIRSYIFSRTLKEAYANTQLVSGNIAEKVRELKSVSGKNIWMFGGANLLTSLLRDGLVDELSLAVHPILLGKGKALFQELDKRLSLKLLDSQAYSSGLVILRYEIVKE